MGRIAGRAKRAAADPEVWAELSEGLPAALPHRFAAVGEAQASGSGSLAPHREVGSALASDGLSLEQALTALRTTSFLVRAAEPTFEETSALAVAWSEATLGYLHRLTCEDPMTGLATHAHVRNTLHDLYRVHDVRRRHALVVIEPPRTIGSFTHALDLARYGDIARTVFAGTETIGSLGAHRLVVVATRDDLLARRVGVLRMLLERRAPRIWIEGLPGTDLAAGGLLDELARS